jgi:hypothetical protein
MARLRLRKEEKMQQQSFHKISRLFKRLHLDSAA